MKRKLFKNIIFVCLLIFQANSISIFSQDTRKLGTTAAAFLRIPVSARATAMGSAFTAMKPDASSLYWNPSGLGYFTQPTVMFDHSSWLGNMQYNFAGIIFPVQEFGTLGLSASVLTSPEMLVTTPAEPMGTGETFSASSMAIGLSYGKMLTDKFSIGGTVKYIYEKIYHSGASGVAFDIGTIYQSPFAGIRIGASISNFGIKMQIDGEDLNVRVDIAPGQEGNNQSIIGRLSTNSFELPLIMRIGISGELIETNFSRISYSVEGVNPNDNGQSLNIGLESSFVEDLFVIRLGYNDLFLSDSETGFTFGAGLNNINLLGNLWVTTDFSYQEFVHLGGITRFTIYLKFN
jgi:hypothetical protein